MSVDSEIEDFAFALFDKLWTSSGFSFVKKTIPDFPDVLRDDFPLDGFCKVLSSFKSLTTSYYVELCDMDYKSFAFSRSDFFNYLDEWAVDVIESGIQDLREASLLLATLAFEMCVACLRNQHYIFVLSCPLAFAMVFEERFRRFFPPTGWRQVLKFDGINQTHPIAASIEGCEIKRQYLIYQLQVLRVKLLNKSPDSLIRILTSGIIHGGRLDIPFNPSLKLSKRRAAMHLPLCIQLLCCKYFDYMQPILKGEPTYQDDHSRKILIQDIAEICGLEGETQEAFVDLYESLWAGPVESSPPPETTPDSPSVHEAATSREDCSHHKDISEAPSLHHDLKTNDEVSHDDPDLHARNELQKCTRVVPKPPSIDEGLELNETPSTSNLPRSIECDAPFGTVDFEDASPPPYESPEAYRRRAEFKSEEKSGGDVQIRLPDYVKPPPYQLNDEVDRHASGPGDGKDTKKYDENSSEKITDYIKPPHNKATMDQPSCDSGAKKLGKNSDHCERFNNDEKFPEDDVIDEYPSRTIDFEDDASPPPYESPEAYKRRAEFKSKEKSGGHIQIGLPDYVKPPPYQLNDEVDRHASGPGDGKDTKKYDENSSEKITDYIKPPLNKALMDQPICDSGAKILGEHMEHCERFNNEDVKSLDEEVILAVDLPISETNLQTMEEENLKSESIEEEKNVPLELITEKISTEGMDNEIDSRFKKNAKDSDPTQKKDDVHWPRQQQYLKDKHLKSFQAESELGSIVEHEENSGKGIKRRQNKDSKKFIKGIKRRQNKDSKKFIKGTKLPTTKKNGSEKALERIQERPLDYKSAYQSDEAHQYAYGIEWNNMYLCILVLLRKIVPSLEYVPVLSDLLLFDELFFSCGIKNDNSEEANCSKIENYLKKNITAENIQLQNKDILAEDYLYFLSEIRLLSSLLGVSMSVFVSVTHEIICCNSEKSESKLQPGLTREAENLFLEADTMKANLKKLKKGKQVMKLYEYFLNINLMAEIFSVIPEVTNEISSNTQTHNDVESGSEKKMNSDPTQKQPLPNDKRLTSSPIESMSITMIAEDEGKFKKGSKKRKQLKKNKHDSDEEIKGSSSKDNDPEKPDPIDVDQMILIMGVSDDTRCKRRSQTFMDRISIKSFKF